MSSQLDAPIVLSLKDPSVPTEREALEQAWMFPRKEKSRTSPGNRVRIPRTFSV